MTKSPPPVGLVLAAGFGQRLRPITDTWPKPLIPFIGATPLAIAYQQLHMLQLPNIWINTHYRYEDFPAHLSCFPASSMVAQAPQVSYEPQILGTGGVVNPLRASLKDSELIIINGDVVAPFDLPALLDLHRRSKAVATMILLPRVIPGETAVWYRDDRIVGIQKTEILGAQPGNFACAQVLSPEFMALLPQSGSFDIINHGYRQALALNMPVSYLLHNDFWFDIGTAQSYFNAVQTILQGQNGGGGASFTKAHQLHLNTCRQWYGKPPLKESAIVSDLETTSKGLVLSPGTMLERGAKIGHQVHLSQAVILPGAEIPNGSHLQHIICGPFGSIHTNPL